MGIHRANLVFLHFIYTMNYQIRKIRLSDNPFIAKVIRNVFHELDAPKEGTAYADPILDSLFEEYQIPQTVYFVVEVDGEICGGAGIGILDTNDPTICELQKMYFAPKIRGKGIAYELIQQCLRFAKQAGYTYCYIETLPFMKAAQQLYSKSGFDYIDKPLGATGHTSCDVFMLKKL
jgi:putative acetyltransferase